MTGPYLIILAILLIYTYISKQEREDQIGLTLGYFGAILLTIFSWIK